MNYTKDFLKFGNSIGIPTTTMESVIDYQSNLTPYILEEREMRVTQMDVFSRLLRDRIIWVSGVVNSQMCDVVQAQLIYLDDTSKSDITLHINSPGGSVSSGLSMVDVINYISCDVVTINMGLCASMGSVLLGAGAKGKRSSLRFSKTMIHQSSGGLEGNIQDARIGYQEWEKSNKILFELLGEFCGKSSDEISGDAQRDKWLDAQEALDYGIIDEIIKPKNKIKYE
jgi:ATP-dependent Clp protease, protease subunit